MPILVTLRCPAVYDTNYAPALRALKAYARFGPDDVRYNPNVQKPNHWVIYIDVHEFLDARFANDVLQLDGKDCLKVYLPNKAYVLVGIGKSQAQCDAEEAAKAAQDSAEAAPLSASEPDAPLSASEPDAPLSADA